MFLRPRNHRTMNGRTATNNIPEGKLRIRWLVNPHTSHCILFVSRLYYQFHWLRSPIFRLANLRFHIYLGRVPWVPASASCQRPSSISPTGPRWHRRWPPKTVHKTGSVAADNLNNQDMGRRQNSTMWMNHMSMSQNLGTLVNPK